jgi:AcrR family transcriptional regulator
LPPRTQAERSQATTLGLVATAQRLFGRDGYAATSIDAIAHESGMTKGAVYHHFAGKTELFRAVFIHQEQQLAQVIASAAAETTDPWDGVRRGARAFLQACTDRQVRQIVLLDGPTVLGWQGVRALQYEHILKLIQNGLTAAAAQEQIAPGDITIRAHLVFGALCEAGMLIARADEPAETLSAVLDQADEMLEALAGKPKTNSDRATR